MIPPSERKRALGVIVSRFPKLTETFVLQELLALERRGVRVELFPLMQHREAVVQPEVARLAASAHYRPLASLRVWQDNAHFLLRRPKRYFRTLRRILAGSRRSPRYLAGAIVFFPKAVSFARAAERLRVEHVHAQFANHPAVAAMVVHGLTGIEFSFTARGSDIHVDKTMLPEKVDSARLVVAVSAYNKSEIVGACGSAASDKVHVVYGGIDIRRFAPAPGAPGPDSFTIVCIGRFEEVKGHAQLIEACSILRTRGAPFTCHLFGDGELRKALERQVQELGLRDAVMFRGSQPQRTIIEALRSASVCVLATVLAADGKREGIPNVLKEAMACGVPVVSSRISGIPELVSDGVDGLLVPPRDAGALAEALLRLAADPELRARMGKAGRARIIRDFNLDESVRRRANLFLPGVLEVAVGNGDSEHGSSLHDAALNRG